MNVLEQFFCICIFIAFAVIVVSPMLSSDPEYRSMRFNLSSAAERFRIRYYGVGVLWPAASVIFLVMAMLVGNPIAKAALSVCCIAAFAVFGLGEVRVGPGFHDYTSRAVPRCGGPAVGSVKDVSVRARRLSPYRRWELTREAAFGLDGRGDGYICEILCDGEVVERLDLGAEPDVYGKA